MMFDSKNAAPLMLEVKQIRNLSKPYQRVTKVSDGDKIAVTSSSGVKKDHTFSLIAHDGVRFMKLVLLFPNQIDPVFLLPPFSRLRCYRK